MCSVPNSIVTLRQGEARAEGDGRADGVLVLVVVVLVAESEDKRRDALGQSGCREVFRKQTCVIHPRGARGCPLSLSRSALASMRALDTEKDARQCRRSLVTPQRTRRGFS